MLWAMAVTTWRITATVLAFVLAVTACSNADDEVAEQLAELDAANATSTTEAPATTTTTAATSTTLSEQDQAEADIRQVVIDWCQFPINKSLAKEG